MARFSYIAAAPSGARVAGSVEADDERDAFARLQRDSLRPIRITPASGSDRRGRVSLPPEAVAELASDLAELLLAGASMKNALAVMASASGDTSSGPAAQALSVEISKGVPLDEAFRTVLGSRYPFLPALIAAGEAAGSLPAALTTIAETIERDMEIAEQVVGALSYPGFVLCMTLGSVLLIVLFVVPALAPIIDEAGGQTSLVMTGLLAVSRLLTDHPMVWMGALSAVAAVLLVSWRVGALNRVLQTLLLDGPLGAMARGIVYGGFARALGQLLAARAPAPEAIRLASGSIRLDEARKRLDGVAIAVGGGASISEALASVSSLPPALSQMARIGEETGALGRMLDRAGRQEQSRALRRIKSRTKWLGPALIIVLGVMIGILMSGLLAGVSGLGDPGLQ
jgi:type II secretory pathway component PulF